MTSSKQKIIATVILMFYSSFYFHRTETNCNELFVTLLHWSLLFVTVPNCFFSEFNCNFAFAKIKIMLNIFLHLNVRHRFSCSELYNGCDRDGEKLPERTRFMFHWNCNIHDVIHVQSDPIWPKLTLGH